MPDPTLIDEHVEIEKSHVTREFKHESPLVACRFHPAEDFVYFAAQDNNVWRWAWREEGATAVRFPAHDSWVRALGFSPDGETLLTGGYDGRLIWWPARSQDPQPIRAIDAHEGWLRALAVSPSGELVGTVGNDHQVKLWSLSDGALIRTLQGHDCHVYHLAFHPQGEALVSGDLKANLIHWEVASGKQVRQLRAESLYKYDSGFRADIGGFRGLVFTDDGKRLAGSGITNVTNAFAGVGNPAIVVLDWESGETVIQHESKAKHKGVAWNLAYHREGYWIGACGGSSGGFLLFWKPEEKEEFHELKLPNTARDLDLGQDGINVATAHYDRHLRITRLAGKPTA